MSEKTRELLRKAIREASPLGADLVFEDSTPLLADGIIDSMGIFGVMTELEGALGFSFPPEELVAENFQSIDTMFAMVQRLIDKGTIPREAAE